MGLSSLFRNRFSRAARASNAQRERRRVQTAALRPEALERRSMLATVTLVNSPNASGSYNAGDQLIIQVEFEAPVTITSGNPILRLNSGNFATFAGQSGAGATLNFLYQVQGPVAGVEADDAGDNSPDLDVLDGAAIQNATFSWSGGTFTPVVPFGADPRSLSSMRNIVIDTTSPPTPTVNELRVNPTIEQTNPGHFQAHPDYFTLTGTAGTGVLGLGETLTVTVNGCTYVLSRGSVGAPDGTGRWEVDLLQPPTSGAPLNPWSTTSIQQYQVEARLTDAAGNTSVGRGFVVIDMVGPTIENVTASNPDGAYTVGADILVEVYFLEPVEVVGTPQLLLQLDAVANGTPTTRLASYDRAESGLYPAGNVAVFRYTILAGDMAADLEYAVANGSAIVLNGGMIQDRAGNPADLTFFAAGTAGSLGFNKNIEIDTAAPPAPVIVTVTDDVPLVTGNVPNNGFTNDQLLLISGTAGTDSMEVEIWINGVPRGFAPVVNGIWSFLSPALPDGQYTFTAFAVDDALNVSVVSNSWNVTVDTVGVAASITSIIDTKGAPIGPVVNGGVTDDTMPTLNGTAQPGSSVQIYQNGLPVGAPVIAGPGGLWTFPIATALAPDGTYVFTAIDTDVAGNIAPPSAPYSVTVDTTAPTVTITRGGTTTLAIGATDVITFVLSEPSANFTAGDITWTNGTISGFAGGSTVYTVTFTPQPGFEGTATISVAGATFTDAAGNPNTASATLSIPVDTRAPGAPLITGVDDDKDAAGNTVTPTNVVSGGRTNDTVLVINGIAEANSTVEVFQDDGINPPLSLGTTTAGAGGVWSFPAGTLTNGTTYSFTAKATDAAGNTGNFSAPPYVVTVDTTAPANPVITNFFDDVGNPNGSIADGGTSDDTTPLLFGTMEAGTTDLEVYVGGDKLNGVFRTQSETTWVFAVANGQLPDGPRTFSAVAIDGAGNRSGASLPYTVTIDTTAVTPSITGVADDKAADGTTVPATNVANGGSTNDTVLVITGTAEAGSTIELFNEVGNTLVLLGNPTSSTAWTFTTGTLAEGKYVFRARITDTAGNVSDLSPPYIVTVDTQAPGRPTISAIVSDTQANPGTVPNGGTTNDATLVLQGKAEPGATILVYESGTTPIGQAIADANGDWSMPTGVLAGGSTYVFTATATDAAGLVSDPSLPAYQVTIDLTPPVAPTINGLADDVAPTTGNVLTFPDARTNDNVLVLTGTTLTPNTAVDIYNGPFLLGPAIVNGTMWSFQTGTLADGIYEFRARAMTAAGNTAFSATSTVTVDTSAPNAPIITAVEDNVLPITSNVPNGGSTNDLDLVIRGTAEPNSTVAVFDGINTSPLGTTTANGAGNWSFSTGTLTNGTTYRFHATATDAVGNVSVPSADHVVTVDTTAPNAPAIDSVTDDVGTVTGALVSGGRTDDTNLTVRVSLAGTNAVVGDSVHLYDGLVALGAAYPLVAGDVANGFVNVQTGTLTNGVTYVITARVIDVAGNASAASGSVTVTVDTTAPNAPAILLVVDDVGTVNGPLVSGARTDDTNLTVRVSLTGTGALAGDTVQLYDGLVALGAAYPLVAGDIANGFVDVQTGSLTNGITYVINARLIDVAGNASAASGNFTVTVDTSAPNAPAIVTVTDDVGTVTGPVVSGGRTDDTDLTVRVSLAGTGAVAGESVQLYDGSTVLGVAVTLVAGDITNGFVNVQTGSLANGVTYLINARVIDVAGNASAASGNFIVTIDTTAPNAPVIVSVTDDVGSVTGALVSGGRTDDTNLTVRVALAGTSAVAGDSVQLYSNGVTPLGAATTLVAGDIANGFIDVQTGPLTNGVAYVIAARVIDVAGNASAASGNFTVTIDTTAPNAPVIVSVTDDVGSVTGALVSGGRTDDTNLTVRVSLAGSNAVVGDSVQLYNNGVTPLGAATTLVAGDIANGFLDVQTGTLTNGVTYVITARVIDVAGNASAASGTFTVTVDTTAPNAPAIVSVTDDVGTVTGALVSGARTDDTNLTVRVSLAGSNAVVGDSVQLYNNGVTPLGAATTLVAGDIANGFLDVQTGTLTNGVTYVVTARVIDVAGNASAASGTLTVTVDTTAPNAPAIVSVTDDVGTVTGALASGGRTDDTNLAVRVSLAGTGVAIGDSVQLYDGTIPLSSAYTITSGDIANGFVTVQADTLVDGVTYAITARAIDAVGNISPASGSVNVTVDITPPAAPVIDQALDNFGKVTGKVAKSQSTDDSTPQLTGTMDPDATRVAIYRNGSYVGDAVRTSSTTWSYASPSLANGTYTFTGRAFDAVGNQSEESSPPYTLTVVGAITASSPTFPASPIRSVSPPITSFSVVFNQPVSGFSVSNLRLFLGGRAVSTRGATVSRAAGSDGTVWIVSLPRTSVNLRGTYRLDIVGANIVSLLTGSTMTTTSSLSWRRV